MVYYQSRMKGDVFLRYIGSKITLLDEIDHMLKSKIVGHEKTFTDLFAGTNTVGNYFKKDYQVYTNDLLFFSYVHSKAIIENNKQPQFIGLSNIGISNPFEYLNHEANQYLLKDTVGYYEQAYTLTGDSQYLSIENGKRIDYIRSTLDTWKSNKLITEIEFYYLLSSLIQAIPFVSNTTGTYGAFLKHWDKRALKPLILEPFDIYNNNQENKSFNQDSNELVKCISSDIVYVDTPYNSRQYASNYHLLENVARNNQPKLKGKTKIFDWKFLRSNFSMKKEALTSMTNLIKALDCTHIIVSYNSDGIITEEELIEIIKEKAIANTIEIKRIPYARYPSKIPSKNSDLYELLVYAQFKDFPKKISSRKKNTTNNKMTNNTHKLVKSPLNYIGGKYKLLNQILPLFPDEIDTFVDLFSGGANVGINVKANKYVFNDMNSRINEMFRYFISFDSDELVNKIHLRIKECQLSKTNEQGFLSFRKQYNENPNPLDLYILISYSYNYQIRFNNSMEFNNPFGKNRSSFSINMENNLRQFIDKSKKLDLKFTDYLFTDFDFTTLNSFDFVYMDPPYLITTGNYNDGNRGFLNWSEIQELEMYRILNDLTKRNIRWALSNVTEHKGKINNLLLNFIDDHKYQVNYLDYHYNNSSYNSKGIGSCEVLITNYDKNTFKILEFDQ